MEVIRTKEQWVLHRLEKFYSNNANLEKVRGILSGDSQISLRLLDWLVTNYAKKNDVAYKHDDRFVNVYLAYKSHLKAYSKKMFDPFCRWKRIKFHDMETTVGQLNFFEWAIHDGVLDYIMTHHTTIHDDMEKCIHEEKETDTPKKRHELSRSATNSLKHHNVRVTVKFD